MPPAECLFCRIIAGQIPAAKVYEDELCLGFSDINPQAPTHALFVPKRHLATINDATAEDRELLGHLMISAAKVAREKGFSETGYRLVLNTNKDAGQTVFHVHLHLLGGRQLTWPPG
jgi:histidine triad (HIT) family protein